MIFNKRKNILYFLNYFLILYPWKSAFIFIAILISGLAEALSFAALIPLLSFALQKSNQKSDDNAFQEYIYNLANFF